MAQQKQFLLVMYANGIEWKNYDLDDMDLLAMFLVDDLDEAQEREGYQEASQRIEAALRSQVDKLPLGTVSHFTSIDGCIVDTRAEVMRCVRSE